MQATRTTMNPLQEQGVSVAHGAILHRARWWETAFTGVSWDYPPSPAAYYDALLSRGASHSRFLRIAYSSTRQRPTSRSPVVSLSSSSPLDTSTSLSPPNSTSITPSSSPEPTVHLTPIPPYSLSRSCVNVGPRSANPIAHTLKHRMPQWPKPPHYHASLLRSPLSHRRGLFRAVLPAYKAVDFFRSDVLGAGFSLSASCQERDWTSSCDLDVCPLLYVVESVLEPYEAAAGFFGWHGLGIDVARRVRGSQNDDLDDDCCYDDDLGLGQDRGSKCEPSDLPLDVDEATVEEGRARWARAAQELVGPPGSTLRSTIEDGKSTKVALPSDPSHQDVIDDHSSLSFSSGREEIQWNHDMAASPFCPSRTPAFDDKRQSFSSSSKAPTLGPSSCFKSDSPSIWCYGASPYRGPPPAPLLPSLRLLPPRSAQCGPPPLQLSPWFPGGHVPSTQGRGYWYGPRPAGSPMTHDPNFAKSFPPPSHVLTTPDVPNSVHPVRSSRHSADFGLAWDGYGQGHDFDRETEVDHGYESATTTTDSDPPPHTPIGAVLTSHCVEALRLHGEDGVDVHGVGVDTVSVVTSGTLRLSDSTITGKFFDRFSMSTSPSMSSDSADSNQDGCESSKTAVVFPSLNGSFCQGSSSRMSFSLSSPGMSAQTTPAGTMTPPTSSSLSSSKELTAQLGPGDEEGHKTKFRSEGCSIPGDSVPSMLSPGSPPSTTPSQGLRRDSQGFWEPVTPISPSSSSSSPPLSPSDGKMRSRPAVGWIGDKMRATPGESPESLDATSLPSTLSAKSRSLSPDPCRAASTGSNCSSSSWPTSFSSPTSTCVFGGSYPSPPSPTTDLSSMAPNPTTLLPAFLTTATVKRKKTSRTREIVDRLRSSSIDAGKGGVALDGLGWLASPGADGEQDGKLTAGSHVAGGQPSPSPPSQPSADSASRVGPDTAKKDGQAPDSKPSSACTSGPQGKSNGTIHVAVPGPDIHFSHTNPRTVTTSTRPDITPFPILSVPQTPAPDFAIPRQGLVAGMSVREPVTAKLSNGADVSKMSTSTSTPPNAGNLAPQLVPSIPVGSTPSSVHPRHLPLPSPSHPIVHPQPPLAPSPMLAVSAYPHPVYVSFTPYQLAPPHQSQQGQAAWLAVYPGHPPHVPVRPLPAQAHVSPITGISGMRHVSW